MHERKIENTIIKVSIVLACLIIGFGLFTKMFTGGTLTAAGQSTGQTKTTAQTVNASTTTAPTIAPDGKVVAIGDSFTYGYPYTSDSSWVALAGKDLKREFVNAGKTGQTSANLLARFQSDVVSQKPSVAIITVGTGDALHGVTEADYEKNMKQLISDAESNGITPVIGLPLDYPDAGAMQLITSYRSWLNTYCAGQGIIVIDFNQGLYDSTGMFLKQYTNDGRYPNQDGYKVMAQQVEQVFTANP